MSYMNEQAAAQLLALARAAIQHGLEHPQPMPLDLQRYPPAYRERAACFVTLHKAGDLRGCVGTLHAYQALALDIVEHAHGAAFADPRFARVSAQELASLHIEVSILGPASAIAFTSEADLLRQLVPFTDGLTLAGLGHNATFLPQVWQQLSEPRDFLAHLKIKAGLPPTAITPALKAYRYAVESFSEHEFPS
ncbi:MAG: AmmeMemoRadiSam system protein A [Bermanella sp.]